MSWQAHFELGKTYRALGDFRRALENTRRAHELSVGLPELHLQLYNLLIQKEAYGEALDELDDFLQLYPDDHRTPTVKQMRERLRTTTQPPPGD